MIRLWAILSFAIFAFAIEQSGVLSTKECNKIFEQRKYELQLQIERIEEKTQALDALNAAQKSQQKERELLLQNKLNQINATLGEIKQKEQSIKTTLEENQKLLEEIKKAKETKIKEATIKMKAGQAAAMLSEMNATEAASILYTMEPKKMAEFIGKMDPKKAADVVIRINQGPPFN